MASRWRPRLLLSAVVALFACEVDETGDSATLEVVVRAEPPIQGSTTFPAEILVGFDSSGSGFLVFRVGFLCSPDAPFFTTATFSAPGPRDGGASVDAWVVPFDGGAPFACGPLATPQRVPSPRAGGVPRTSARVEVLGGCGPGEVRSATLVIGASS